MVNNIIIVNCCKYFTKFISTGKLLYVGNGRQWPALSGRAALLSPIILTESNICQLVFYYRLKHSGRSSLSLYLQKQSGKIQVCSVKKCLYRVCKRVEGHAGFCYRLLEMLKVNANSETNYMIDAVKRWITEFMVGYTRVGYLYPGGL